MSNLLETSASRKPGAQADDRLARLGKCIPPSTAVTVGTIVIFAIAVAIISAFGVTRNEVHVPAANPNQTIPLTGNDAG